MAAEKYFIDGKKKLWTTITFLLVCFFVFSVIFFMWSTMRYNETMEEMAEKEAYIKELTEDIEELEYLIAMPLDDDFKIRIAREKLGMCFPDEIIYYTDIK